MQVQAKLYGVRLSAQKGRLVADLVRGQPIASALNILTFTPKKGTRAGTMGDRSAPPASPVRSLPAPSATSGLSQGCTSSEAPSPSAVSSACWWSHGRQTARVPRGLWAPAHPRRR